ncbi:hemin uptake protein HemP [Roseibium salinum]|uniref:Hemin uptake protein HemP n=1 Tax=Roseibium salinum TaxID=1604349 RepID=A0ABT3R4M9_9HYPH|nr:hemin uptake protein HemP [Roseibium sp. DSM 29163]MCX2724090.1 hemin uptake protein HemP [Roseibium sp. DSM 29163]MDN3721844.1 hemin uptake protein HemP [Roseibium salinum]
MTPTANSQKNRLSLASAGRTRNAFAVKPRHEPRTNFDSSELFDGVRQIHIHHNDETYRLSITKQGKLILTK